MTRTGGSPWSQLLGRSVAKIVHMRIKAKFACGSVLFASFVPALLGQTPSKPASAVPSASGQPPASQRSISPPAETPAMPPQVTYHDGLLSIRAENSTLGDVLRAVQNATGATIESPGLTSERVYVKLGPGEGTQWPTGG